MPALLALHYYVNQLDTRENNSIFNRYFVVSVRLLARLIEHIFIQLHISYVAHICKRVICCLQAESLQREILDLQSEFEFDRIDYLDSIRKQEQQIKWLEAVSYSSCVDYSLKLIHMRS